MKVRPPFCPKILKFWYFVLNFPNFLLYIPNVIKFLKVFCNWHCFLILLVALELNIDGNCKPGRRKVSIDEKKEIKWPFLLSLVKPGEYQRSKCLSQGIKFLNFWSFLQNVLPVKSFKIAKSNTCRVWDSLFPNIWSKYDIDGRMILMPSIWFDYQFFRI